VSAREPEPPTCARCGKAWTEPHRAYPAGTDDPVCMPCFFAPEAHEAIGTLADVVAYRRGR